MDIPKCTSFGCFKKEKVWPREVLCREKFPESPKSARERQVASSDWKLFGKIVHQSYDNGEYLAMDLAL